MVENTKIEWAHHTFNPWVGCQKVGPGCDHCYAEVANGGAHAAKWGPHADRVRTKPRNWNMPRKWDRAAAEAGERHRVFCSSLADVFDNHKSVQPEWRADLAELIRATPNLDWLLLTKRVGNADRMLCEMFPEGTPSNIWVGATITGQAEADRDIPRLVDLKSRHNLTVAYLSMEPLLSPVDLTNLPDPSGLVDSRMDALRGRFWMAPEHVTWPVPAGATIDGRTYVNLCGQIDWVIVGGETGSQARPMHIDWVRSLRDQCAAAGTSFLFKQWGNWFPYGEVDGNGTINSQTRGETRENWYSWDREDGFSVRLDKRVAGRFLDGRTWDATPKGHAA